jgi:uncharacterized protein YjiS (DUF1127 family)
MTTFALRLSRIGRRRRSPALGAGLRSLLGRIRAWRERARQRRHLAGLNDHMLRDIGLTRGDVMAESSKPFWRV